MGMWKFPFPKVWSGTGHKVKPIGYTTLQLIGKVFRWECGKMDVQEFRIGIPFEPVALQCYCLTLTSEILVKYTFKIQLKCNTSLGLFVRRSVVALIFSAPKPRKTQPLQWECSYTREEKRQTRREEWEESYLCGWYKRVLEWHHCSSKSDFQLLYLSNFNWVRETPFCLYEYEPQLAH